MDPLEKARSPAEEQTFFTQISAALTPARDVEALLKKAVGACVPFLADCCVADLHSSGGKISTVAVSHINFETERIIRGILSAHGSFTSLFPLLRCAARSSRSLLFPVLQPLDTAAAADILACEFFDFRSCISVPLSLNGMKRAVMIFLSGSKRVPYTLRDVRLAEEAAEAVSASFARAETTAHADRAVSENTFFLEEKEQVPCGHRATILIVEDDRASAAITGMLLQASGYEVLIEHDGYSALTAAAARRPDVVLLDIGIPGLDGCEVARRLKSEATLPEHAVVIALTGYGHARDMERSRLSGVDYHLIKPLEPSELLNILSAQLAQ